MIVSELITKVQGKFEGGKSFTVDWFAVVKEGVRNLRKRVNPAELLLTEALVEVTAGDNTIFTAPDDFYRPSMIYSSNGERVFTYVKRAKFLKEETNNTYTVFKVDGVETVQVSHAYSATETFTMEYFSSKAFLDATTGLKKSDPEVGDDVVNLGEDLEDIALYEVAMVVVQEGVVGSERNNEEKRFAGRLKELYYDYGQDHESTQEVDSYQLGNEITLGT